VSDEALAQAGDAYDRYYYNSCCSSTGYLEYGRTEHWLSFFGTIADRIVSDLRPRTVLDAGCAMGILVESLRDRGVEAYGIDVSTYALEHVRADISPYCTHASVLDPFPQRYDVITCIETLEHLPAAQAERAVTNICAHTDDVLFCSTPTHFKEVTHLNVRPPEYWAELFARSGLYRDVDYEPSSYIARWAVRFRRTGDPPARVAGNLERLVWRLHQENLDLRELSNDLQSELARSAESLRSAHERVHELDGMQGTTSWRLASAISRIAHRLLPPTSRRRAWVARLGL
jgi:SAM-dependent methyltransferase